MSEIGIKEKRERIIGGLESAYEKMIEFKKIKNSPVIISRNGEVIEVKASDAPAKVKYVR